MTSKPRIIKAYEKLSDSIQEQIKLSYPHGFSKYLIKYRNAQGEMVSALPFETDEYYYLVRMTVVEAREIILKDDDYSATGKLKDHKREAYEDKYADLDDDDDDLDDDIDDDDEGVEENIIVPFDENSMED
jgi:hypothetical protein